MVNNTFHPNGATGIQTISIATDDPKVSSWYRSLLSGDLEMSSNTGCEFQLSGSDLIVHMADTGEKTGPDAITLKKGNETLFYWISSNR